MRDARKMKDKEIWLHTSSIMQRCVETEQKSELDKRLHLHISPPTPKKDHQGRTKNCKDINLIAIAVKVYNALLLRRIQSEVEKILRKKAKRFSKTSINNFLDSDYSLNHRRNTCKNLEITLLFDFINR